MNKNYRHTNQVQQKVRAVRRSKQSNFTCTLLFKFFLSNAILITLLNITAAQAANQSFPAIEWVDLIPKAELDILMNPPEAINAIPHGTGAGDINDISDSLFDALNTQDAYDQLTNESEQSLITSDSTPSPEEQAYSAALESININQQFDQKNIRIPGFIVPLEYNDQQVVTEFFLVPYFGACIHVPPPPPNQIIYVKYPKGLSLDALYDPFWIEGQLNTNLTQNDLATSAYGMTAVNIKEYTEYQQ